MNKNIVRIIAIKDSDASGMYYAGEKATLIEKVTDLLWRVQIDGKLKQYTVYADNWKTYEENKTAQVGYLGNVNPIGSDPDTR